MRRLRLSKSLIINCVIALAVIFVAFVLVSEFRDLVLSRRNTEIQNLAYSLAVSLLAYLLKAVDLNRQSIQELRRDIEALVESKDGLNQRDEIQQQKLIQLETQLAAQERYYWLKEKVDRLLESESKPNSEH